MVRHVPLGVAAAVIVAAVLLANQYVGRMGEWDRVFLLWGTIGFLAGAGIGFAYVCPIAALVKWFPHQKGLVSGIAVAGFGLGAFIFSRPELDFSARRYIETHGIINLFLIHGIICLVVITLGAMLLRNPPGTPPKTALAESSWQDTLRRPAFYILWAMFFSGALAGLMVIGVVSPFVTGQLGGGPEAAQIGAVAVGVLSVFNALGRVVWGLASDRIGRTPTFIAMFVIQAVVMFVLAGLDTKTALYVGAGLVGFNFGGNFALFPSATADLFGAKNLGANYGWVFTSYGVAGVVGIYAGNIAKIRTGSYRNAFILAAVLCLISAVLAVGLRLSQAKKTPV
jgi:OFA family oxalate/formate antiporter-like MFS transporter